MKSRVLLFCFWLLIPAGILRAQEASSGFDLGVTLSGETLYSPELSSAPRNGASAAGAFRAILYPTYKISDHWAASAAVEAYSHPYFFQDISTNNRGVAVDLLQAQISYSRFWGNRSLILRAGQLSSAFGSFLLRYDDSANPLIDMPKSYGYYQNGVSTDSLAGVEMDNTFGKFDLRNQITNSSPANPRSLAQNDQYVNWTGGAGYTIRQGLRVGVSAYRGPYLDHQFPYYFPGEWSPNRLPATAVGADMQWGQGHWNINGEWQRFQMDYHAIPTFIEQTGYGEVRVNLSPRWYAATRLTYVRASAFSGTQAYEFAAGYRLGKNELMKVDYEINQGANIKGAQQNVLAIQFVASLHPLSYSHQ
ncbi:MAG TPA: hypothetical protein VFE02_10665 [Candidatus Acidoferrales bacterium]|jgi:hypothetical protein|nr:hypothetical protein [Candidatus Acidoferrales bacterium]